jgi:hypothetical protein
MNTENKNNIVIYEDKKGNVELRADIEKDTIWATQVQVAQLFESSKQTVSRHLIRVFDEGELNEESVVKEYLTTGTDGKKYMVKYYNLDAVIAVGYRVNSKKATKFRIWATRVLKKYLVEGHALNKRRIESTHEKLVGLYETIAFLESKSLNGKLRGKITLKLTEELEPNEE